MISDTQQPELKDDTIELSVVHGHLAFARFPVLVGHYSGDVFAGTEARLDRALGSRLSDRRKLGLYPGGIGTSAILLDLGDDDDLVRLLVHRLLGQDQAGVR